MMKDDLLHWLTSPAQQREGGVALFCQAAEFTSNKLLSQTWLFLLIFNEVAENDHNIPAVPESEIVHDPEFLDK